MFISTCTHACLDVIHAYLRHEEAMAYAFGTPKGKPRPAAGVLVLFAWKEPQPRSAPLQTHLYIKLLHENLETHPILLGFVRRRKSILGLIKVPFRPAA